MSLGEGLLKRRARGEESTPIRGTGETMTGNRLGGKVEDVE